MSIGVSILLGLGTAGCSCSRFPTHTVVEVMEVIAVWVHTEPNHLEWAGAELSHDVLHLLLCACKTEVTVARHHGIATTHFQLRQAARQEVQRVVQVLIVRECELHNEIVHSRDELVHHRIHLGRVQITERLRGLAGLGSHTVVVGLGHVCIVSDGGGLVKRNPKILQHQSDRFNLVVVVVQQISSLAA